jgi:hypothetical protein
MVSDAPAGAQHVAGDGEFVGGGADIAKTVVEDEVFEVDEFAVDPQGSAGVGEILPFKPSAADGGAGDALVEAGESAAGVGDGFQQGVEGQFCKIVRHCFYGKQVVKGKLPSYYSSAPDIKEPVAARHR